MIQAVYQCILLEHDYRLVLLAAAICLFSSYTSMSLLQRARQAEDGAKKHWTVLTAIAAGAGVWATHFVAMIAYDPGMPVAYDVVITLISVLVAVVITGLGFAIFIYQDGLGAIVAAGVVAGLGIAAMHLTGMTGVRLSGYLEYDTSFITASVLIGIGLCITTFYVMRDGVMDKQLMRAMLIFTLAICGLHFTAMTAVSVQFDPTIAVPGLLASKTFLVMGVTLAAGLLLALTLASALIDRHLAANFAREVVRLRGLANAAIEGVVLLDQQGRIIDANTSFLDLTGRRIDVLKGLSFIHCFRNMEARARWEADDEPASPTEAVAIHASGDERRVEIILRSVPGHDLPGPVAIIRNKSPI